MNERLKLILVLVITAAITGPLSCCIGWGTARMFPGKPGGEPKGGPAVVQAENKGGSKADLVSLGMTPKEIRDVVGFPSRIDVQNNGDVWIYPGFCVMINHGVCTRIVKD